MTAPVTPAPAASLRILALALAGAPLAIGVVLVFAARPEAGQSANASVAVVGIEIVVAALAALVLEAVGYRIQPLDATLDADKMRSQALLRFQSAMFRRFALAEVVVLVAIVLTFTTEPHTVLNYIVGAALGVILIAVHVWPNSRVVIRSAAALDRDGAHSQLAELFGIGG